MRVRRLTVVGAGGTGQHFTPTACRLMLYHGQRGAEVVIIDADKYEPSNKERQAGNMGEEKVEYLYLHHLYPYFNSDFKWHRMIRFIESDVEFGGILAKGHSPGDGTFDVVAMCVDNDATRRLMYRGIEQTAVPCWVIDMGNEEFTGDVVMCAHIPGAGWIPHNPFRAFPQLENPADRTPGGYCGVKAPTHPQLVTANQFSATLGCCMLGRILAWEPGTDMPYHLKFDVREGVAFDVHRNGAR